MTLEKVDGRWIGDFRYKGFPRLRLSMRTAKKGDAEDRHDAVAKLFRQNRRDLIAQLRLPKGHPQRLTVERLAQMVEDHEPLLAIAVPDHATAPLAGDPWGTVQETIGRYLDWLEKHPNKSAQTVANARSQLKRFAAFQTEIGPVGDLALTAVTSTMVEAYQAQLRAEGAAKNTVADYMTRVGALWTWQGKQEAKEARDERRAARVLFSPIDPEMMAREKTARERFLDREEADRLLAATPDPLVAFMALGLLSGLRLGEAQHLTLRDVDLEIGLVQVREKTVPDGSVWKPKTRRSRRSVPIAPDLVPALERHLARHAGDLWLFPRGWASAWPVSQTALDDEVRETVRRAGLTPGRKDPSGVTYHTLRHTFASWLVMKGVDLYTVAQLLGDTLATVEKTYAHLSPDYKKAAVTKLAGAVKLPLDLTQKPGVLANV